MNAPLDMCVATPEDGTTAIVGVDRAIQVSCGNRPALTVRNTTTRISGLGFTASGQPTEGALNLVNVSGRSRLVLSDALITNATGTAVVAELASSIDVRSTVFNNNAMALDLGGSGVIANVVIFANSVRPAVTVRGPSGYALRYSTVHNRGGLEWQCAEELNSVHGLLQAHPLGDGCFSNVDVVNNRFDFPVASLEGDLTDAGVGRNLANVPVCLRRAADLIADDFDVDFRLRLQPAAVVCGASQSRAPLP